MTSEWRPRLPRGVRLRHDASRKRWVLLAPERIFEVDDTGVEILRRCDGRAFADLVGDLAAHYATQPAEIAPDVVEFLRDFAEKRIVDLT
jgi:pyrroloquinoline quinone biosynthesis protein D